jgi:outer membrane protein assembly factor BamB|tara:strand:+ start:274 stop:1527 length:1254 start_codon:yes stop_codon:yes gene_type:complete
MGDWIVRRVTVLWTGIVLLLLSGVSEAENWGRFRGPNGKGISTQKGIPVSWTDKDYKWKTPLPGLGHSSPCVWGNHVFVTSALDRGAVRLVISVDAASGKVLWTDRLASRTHSKHSLNSYASGTPASDGKRVFVLFTTDEDTVVRAYDFAGKRLWQTDIGKFYNQHGHGCGTSPIVWRDTVIVASQHDGPSVIAGLDAATGKIRWRSERKVKLTAHSTPVILEREGKTPQLFTSNTGDGLASFDPRNGKLLWRANLFTSRAVNSPFIAGDLVMAITGGGGRGKQLFSVSVDQAGEVGADKVVWSGDRNLPYVPTPLVFGKHLYFWCDNGVVSCLDPKTGKAVWTERVGGKFWASPICIDGKIYNISDKGEVIVIASGTTFKVLGKSQLGEQVHGTPAVAGGRMFLRGFENLYCLEAK